jgi:hypothetical protein
MLLSVGDQIEPSDYRAYARDNYAAHFISNTGLISVVHPAWGAGALQLVVKDMPLEEIKHITVAEDNVLLNDTAFPITDDMYYNSTLNTAHWAADHLHTNLQHMHTTLKQKAPDASLVFLIDPEHHTCATSAFQRELVKEVRAGAEDLFSGSIILGVKRVRGCNLGLGADGNRYMAGIMTGLNALQAGINCDFRNIIDLLHNASRVNNLVVRNQLNLAAEGRANAYEKTVVQAVFAPSEEVIPKAVSAYLQSPVPHSADFCTGLFMAIHAAVFNRQPPFTDGGHT